MKSYYHSIVLSQRLSAFYDGNDPEYLIVEVDGFKERLMLKAKPGSEFMAMANEDKFILWEKSGYSAFDPKEVLNDVREDIKKINFLGKEFKTWREFERFLEDPEIVEPVYRSTVWFPKSLEVAIKLRSQKEGNNIKQVIIDALKAYL